MKKKILILTLMFMSFTSMALSVGDVAPGFSLPDQNNENKTLDQHRGQWVILYFYPMDDTPGCTTEACSFRDATDRIISNKSVVYGISVDSVESHKIFSEKNQLSFSLLADTSGSVSKSYNSLAEFLNWKVAMRNTFIINPEGLIVKKYLGVDPTTHVQKVLKDLMTLQAQTS